MTTRKGSFIEVAGLVLAAGTAFGEPAIYWHFDEGKPGDTAAVLAPASGGESLKAAAGVFGKGAPPAHDSEIPLAMIWDGGTYSVANHGNKGSLLFTHEGDAGSLAPSGGELTVSGADPKTQPVSLTVEAFVKMRRQMPRHALLASKRRNGQRAQAGRSRSIRQGVSACGSTRNRTGRIGTRRGSTSRSARPPASTDGAWHHVALTFDHATRSAALYLDYARCGGGVAARPLVYDDSALVIGRGLDGWLDEVRLTPEALHPEQFLRPRAVLLRHEAAKPPAGSAARSDAHARAVRAEAGPGSGSAR